MDDIPEQKLLYGFLVDCDEIITMLVHDEGAYILNAFSRRDRTYRHLVTEAWDEARKGLIHTKEIIIHEHDRYSERLSERGLSGKQLRFKMYLLERFKKRFRTTASSTALRRLLGHMDTLLKSMSGVFLPLDPVSEFKESLERITKVYAKPKQPANNEIEPTG